MLALSLWVGGLSLVSFIVAPAVFGFMETRKSAGDLFGIILDGTDRILMMCIILLVGTSLAKFFIWERAWNLVYAIRYGAIFVMCGIALYTSFSLTPRLKALKSKIRDLRAESIEKSQFDSLHKLSVRYSGSCLILGLVAMFFQ